ncbi:MAG TPA: hypothetical protein VLG37_01665 [Candidatus Saccharimonadales bacterium]|nr:hypothetical protein [Candidatus Saccharimonadales bacterium]
MNSQYYTPKIHKQSIAFLIGGLLLLIAALLLWIRPAKAAEISYDPYADSVAGTAAAVLDANNAVGAPNGTSATLVGVGASLTLDMGAGEEGTQSLKVYLGQINAQVNITVDFLDNNQSVITSETRQLGADPNPSTQNFAYNWTNFGKAYRYVRLSSAVGGGVNVDAVEALGYIGSTASQDTDGDGRADRSEQQNGTNPLVPDPPLGSSPTPALPGSSTSSSGSGTARGNSSTVSGQVNPPPAAGNDKDHDQMDDTWEVAHGLNPNDPSDAKTDLDHDGLSNLTEFQIGSDPTKMDTDGDGMPDKWEYDHALNINKNDADADPDGDYLTNLGEYRNNTDPNKADNLRDVFCTTAANKRSRAQNLGIILSAGGGIAACLAALAAGRRRPEHHPQTLAPSTP